MKIYIIGDFILRNTRCFSVELEVRNTFPILEFIMFDIFLHIVRKMTYLRYIFVE
jgi:hypothetical protein